MNINDLTPEDAKKLEYLMIKAATNIKLLKREDVEFLSKFSLSNAEGRECGDCIYCCQAPAIEESSILADEPIDFDPKPACVECYYAVEGVGCTVYSNRPTVCKSYKCLYLLGLTDVRPDKGGVAWSFQPWTEGPPSSMPLMVTGHCLDVVKALLNPKVMDDINSIFNLGIEVIAMRDDKMATQLKPGKGNCIIAKIDPKDSMKVKILEGSECDAPWHIELLKEEDTTAKYPNWSYGSLN